MAMNNKHSYDRLSTNPSIHPAYDQTFTSVYGQASAHPQTHSVHDKTLTNPQTHSAYSLVKLARSPHDSNGTLGTMSLWEATISLAKSAVGAGALFMPLCFLRLGLLGGLIGILLAMVLTVMSLTSLGIACQRTGTNDYLQLANALGGPKLEFLTVIFIIAVMFAPIIVYIRLSSAYLVNVMYYFWGISSEHHVVEILLSIFVLWPMSWIRDGRRLAQFSSLGMLGMIYVAGLSLVDFLLSTSWDFSAVQWFNYESTWKEAFGCLSMILFSFNCHFTLPIILRELERPTAERSRKMIITSNCAAATFYLLIGVSGYLQFGPQITGDMLAIKPSNAAYIFGQLSIAVVNVVSFPLIIIPVRGIIQWGCSKLGRNGLNQIEGSDALQGAIIILVGLLVNSQFQSTAKVLDLIGSICGGPVTLILPALFFRRSVSTTNPIILILYIFGLCMLFGGILCLFL
jgi:sodium-coupled neutral amino acid transporter 7/8